MPALEPSAARRHAEEMSALRDYAATGNDAAFQRVVSSYQRLVLATARRITGDAHLAEDIAQIVFANLAAKAGSFSPEIILPSWLYRHTCHTAWKMQRAEARRKQREQLVSWPDDSPPPAQTSITACLDNALMSLPEKDRTALVLRFFERMDYRALGAHLGLSDDAAQKRVSRALERLRQRLEERDLHLSTSALPALLLKESSAGIFGWAAGVATMASFTAGPGFLSSMIPLMTTKTALLVATGALVGLGTAFFAFRPDPRESPPVVTTSVAPPPPPGGSPGRTGKHAASPKAPRIMEDPLFQKGYQDGLRDGLKSGGFTKRPEVTPEEIDAFLARTGRSPASLAWAFTQHFDLAFIREALAKDSENPLLHFVAVANYPNPEEEFIAASLAWVERHHPAFHAVLTLNQQQPLSAAQLSALNNADDLEALEKTLRQQDADFLVGIRGLTPDEAPNQSLIKGATVGQITTIAVFSKDTPPPTALVAAMSMSRSDQIDRGLAGLTQERVLYHTMSEEDVRRLTGKSKSEALASVDEELTQQHELHNFQTSFLQEASPEQTKQYRELTAILGEKAALEHLRAEAATPIGPAAPEQ